MIVDGYSAKVERLDVERQGGVFRDGLQDTDSLSGDVRSCVNPSA